MEGRSTAARRATEGKSNRAVQSKHFSASIKSLSQLIGLRPRQQRNHLECSDSSTSSSNSSSRSCSVGPKGKDDDENTETLSKKCTERQSKASLDECLRKLGENIEKRKKKSRKKYLNTATYSTKAFAGGMFDHKGGELVVAEGSIRLRITPNAVNPSLGPCLVYIYLTRDKDDYPSPLVRGVNLSPVVLCGPQGLSFEKPVLLTVQTAIEGECKKFKVLKSETKLGEECKWQVANDKEAHCIWSRGRCITAVKHFTLYRVIGIGGESILKGVFKVQVYAHDETENSVKLRLRVFPDTEADTQIVESLEREQRGTLVSGHPPHKISIEHGKGIDIKLKNLSSGWSTVNGTYASQVTADFIWQGRSRQQSGIFRTFSLKYSECKERGSRLKFIVGRLCVHENGRPGSGAVINIRKDFLTPDAQYVPLHLQSTARRPANAEPPATQVTTVDREFRKSLLEFQRVNNDKFSHIMSYELYVDLCVMLDIKGNNDARFFAEKLGLGTETILYLTENVSSQSRSMTGTILDFMIEQRIQNGGKKRDILTELESLLRDIGNEQAANLVGRHLRPKDAQSANSTDSGVASLSSGEATSSSKDTSGAEDNV